jgi:L-ascorbate metabolism protein UlaG (beta-lactamase superfamily)
MWIALSSLLILALAAGLFLGFAPVFGAAPAGERLARVRASAQHDGRRFVNAQPPTMRIRARTMLEFFVGGRDREPAVPLPAVTLGGKEAPAGGTSVRWLGHSALLLEMAGRRILIDPALSRRASFLPFFGPRRFPCEPPIRVEDLPRPEIVLISHDHYDHLDRPSILALLRHDPLFVVPLGVGAHLERWGVGPERIIELDWWESVEPLPGLRMTAAPAQHFSGRGLFDRNRTLWASWVLEGEGRRLFFGGDSGWFDGFAEIGRRCGPFDLALLECGAYHADWQGIHMLPEETLLAGRALGAKIIQPIHWGAFNLALHPWREPVERLLAAADPYLDVVATPRPGQAWRLEEGPPLDRWWRSLEAPPGGAGR